MNQENKKQIIFAGVLGVVLVGVLIYQFAFSGGPSGPPAVKEQVSSNAQPAAAHTGTPAAGQAAAGAANLDDSSSLDKLGEDLSNLVKKVSDITFRYEDEKIVRNPFAPVRIITQGDPTSGEVFDTAMIDKIPKAISGIIFDEEVPYAVIEDNLVTVGHRFAEGVVLERIERTQVIIKVGDAEIPLKLMKEQ